MNHPGDIFRLWKQPVTIGNLLLYKHLRVFLKLCASESQSHEWLCRLDCCTGERGLSHHQSPSNQEPCLGLSLETQQSVCGSFCRLFKGGLNWHVRGWDDIYMNSICVTQAWIVFSPHDSITPRSHSWWRSWGVFYELTHTFRDLLFHNWAVLSNSGHIY